MVRYISVEGATIRVTGAIRVRDAVKHRVTVRLQSVYTQPKNTDFASLCGFDPPPPVGARLGSPLARSGTFLCLSAWIGYSTRAQVMYRRRVMYEASTPLEACLAVSASGPAEAARSRGVRQISPCAIGVIRTHSCRYWIHHTHAGHAPSRVRSVDAPTPAHETDELI